MKGKAMKKYLMLFFILLSAFLYSCHNNIDSTKSGLGGGGNTGTQFVDKGVSVTPNIYYMIPFSSNQFTASTAGSATFNWEVVEAGKGSISSGMYNAPADTGIYHIKAIKSGDTSKYGFATIYVVLPSSSSYYYTGTLDYKVNGIASGITFNDEIVFNTASITLDGYASPSYGNAGWRAGSHINTQYTVYDTVGTSSSMTSNGLQTANDTDWAVEVDFDTSGNKLYILINNLVMNVTFLPQYITGSYFISGGQFITTLPADKTHLVGSGSGTTVSGVPFTLSWDLTIHKY
jgi:hypothetical protein